MSYCKSKTLRNFSLFILEFKELNFEAIIESLMIANKNVERKSTQKIHFQSKTTANKYIFKCGVENEEMIVKRI
jgi:hypothetical protein